MHWLQSLDTSLFLFANRSLVNPVFDWLMPVLSGNAFFYPVLFLTAIGLLWKGSRRMRVCVVMLALILPLSVSLVCNTIKHTVHRPRPYVTLPQTRLWEGVDTSYVPPETNNVNDANMAVHTTGHDSMPSGHASNWFAATLIFFVYYRRSLRFTLPMALAVSFSRLYNGVHYPSDLLVGSIVGSGAAVASLVVIEWMWRTLGKKWFPLWHARMPSVLNPDIKGRNSAVGGLRSVTSDQQWLRFGYIVIFASLIGHWIYVGSGLIELSGDEAYQWIWSKHLALSYYSKPPGIALIQFAGTHLFGNTGFGVRFFSPLITAVLSVMVLRFFAREISAAAGFCLLLAVSVTPLFGVGSILMTIDPPLVLCWTWALIAGWRASQPDGRTRDWLVAGLAMGLGFLCKYSALYQIICFGIFFALWAPARIHLRKPGPWLALVVFLICTLPVLIWNAQHGWITVTHVAGNAGLKSRWQPTLRYLGDFFGSEFILLNPVFFIAAIWAAFGFWKFRKQNPLWVYFFSMGAPVLLGHVLWSFHSRVQANWIAPAVPPMFCLMIVYWQEQLRAGSRLVKPFWTTGLTLGFFIVALMYAPNLIGKITGHPLPGEMDMSHRVRSWADTAASIEPAREKLEAEGKPVFIIADNYALTGLLSFYLPPARAGVLKDAPLVYCENSEEPENQFYFWPEYNYLETRKGQNAIYVEELNPFKLEHGWIWDWLAGRQVKRAAVQQPATPGEMTKEFESITDLGEVDVRVGGRIFHRVHLWACYNLK
ncbi:MAG TPA: glycosyltransferase family 39 protein [Candidatus Aquilonibacter sp.]|nr:glycosyltransferase family 39 protein [Candidatus Aquilonibacter sp.]